MEVEMLVFWELTLWRYTRMVHIPHSSFQCMCDNSLQLELCKEMSPQGMEWRVSTIAPHLSLRYCEGEMEGMDRMECLVPTGHKDKGERLEQQALRVPLAQGVVE